MIYFRTDLEVEEKYNEYVNSNFAENLKDAITWLGFYIEEMKDFVAVGLHEVRKDKVEYIKASCLSIFQNIISGITNPLAIKAEIDVMGKQIVLARDFCSLEEMLLDSIDDSNYQDVLNLGSFCYSTYLDLEENMILSQDAIYYNIDSGVEEEYHPNAFSPIMNSSFLVQDFLKKKMMEIKNTEAVAKVKKM